MMSAFETRQSGEAAAIICRPLEDAGFLNAFSTRPGGVSDMPKGDLNLAFNEDAPSNVEENRRRFLRAAGLPSLPLLTARQVHGAAVVEGSGSAAEPEADAVFTRARGELAAVKTADCLPVLVGDPSTGLACAIHAGWRGAAINVIAAAIDALKAAGASTGTMLAALGPAACVRCFEVGPEVIEKFSAIPGAAVRINGKHHLDIEAVAASQLEASGVPPGSVYFSRRCTIHEAPLFFSHRREGKLGRPVGRMLSAIGPRP